METNHKTDYENFEIIDKANHDLKLSYKKMLHIRKQKSQPLIIRNVEIDNAITRDVEKYINQNQLKTSNIRKKFS